LSSALDKHYRVLQMKVRFAMATFTQVASSAIWIVISALLITIIFRIFTRYVSSVSPDAVQNMFNRGAP
jgi:ubiquinone/menaquinone biosynthesis C-methylase UbiE